jgi:heme/copper-type cytochrome/quinol oxidase subunit 3
VNTTAWGVELVHIAMAIAIAAFALVRAGQRRAAGQTGGAEPPVAAVAALFWHYTVLQWVAGFAVVHLFPFVA